MRKLLLLLAPIALLAFSSGTLADTINYSATASIMGQSFTFTFSEPSTLTSLDTFTTATFTEGSLTLTGLPVEVTFFAAGQSGLIDIIASIEGTDTFEFFGAQIYSGTGPFNLLTGNFPLSSALRFGDLLVGGTQVATFDGGTVTATSANAAPEPATLALLGSGLIGVAAVRRKKRLA